MDINNWNLGRYIMFAFNDPKKYPEKPFLTKEPVKVMTAQEMERRMRANNIILGGTTK